MYNFAISEIIKALIAVLTLALRHSWDMAETWRDMVEIHQRSS